MPSGGELAAFLLDACHQRDAYGEDELRLDKVVDFLTAHHVGEDELLDLAAAHIAAKTPQKSPLVEALIRVPSRFLLTLNFDLALERAVPAEEPDPVSLGNGAADLERALQILTAEQPPEALTVLHLHGSVEAPREMVLGSKGYARLGSDFLRQLIQELAVHRNLVFYGTQLAEVYLLSELEKVAARNDHVLWCTAAEEPRLTDGRLPILQSRTGIFVCTVPNHEDLAATVTRLLAGEPPSEPPIELEVAELGDSVYVENHLLDRRDPNDPEDLTLASLGFAPQGELRPDPTESDALNAPRTVIVGDPGSGKSELLRQLTARAGPPRPGILIRLADLDFDPKLGPRQTLAAWAQRGITFHAGVDVSAAALESRRYHFFLDGLDEVGTDRQEEIATRIRDLASELPRHAFTVASRPLPVLDLLRVDVVEMADWSQFALSPDLSWRDRYLREHQITLEQLYDDMPALVDMADVLTTPFYLSQIVELHQREELRGLPDFGALLAALIDSALAREQGALNLDNDEIRTWLRQLALAAVISGRRTFSAEELGLFTLPPDSTGDSVELARSLRQRLLIAQDRGSFRFHHRLLGEQLAAEALVELGPLPTLLECLVPCLDEMLAGIRPDVVVPVGLACLRSSEWRLAVARRDPLAVARATPDDATPARRRAALAALWQNAVDSQIWIWEHGSQLTDDAEAGGRLLRTVPRSAPAQAIEAAVHNGTPQDQGNAIRILVRARARGLRKKLATVLGDRERNGVVLRQAAIGAAEAGFVDLVDQIAEMMLKQSDTAIHQDGIIALTRLMANRPRIDVYARLMAGPEADYLLAVVVDRLPAGDGLTLLAAYFEHEHKDGYGIGDKVSDVLGRVRPDELSDAHLEAAVDVAIQSGKEGETVTAIYQRDPELTLRRLAQLCTDRQLGWWQVVNIAIAFEPEQLRRAGLPEEVVERVVQAARRRAELSRPEVVEQAEREAAELAEEEAEETKIPTLGELLDDPETDGTILHNANYFAPQVGDLDQPRLAELRTRLERWWPDKPYRKTITRLDANRWRQESGAAAWNWFGPEAKPTLSPERWAGLATSGILFTAQIEWLRETQTPAAIDIALGLLGAASSPELWHQFLSCCADPLPNAVLLSCVSHLDTAEEAGADGTRYRLKAIAQRFIDNGRPELLAPRAETDQDFAALLSPILAAGGDLDAQRHMLRQLVDTLDRGELPEERELAWMSALDSPEMLDGLFAVLRHSFKTSDAPLPRVRSGYDLHDVTSPTIEAISRIDGRQAVAAYDALINEGGDFRWLDHQRRRLAAAVLASDGQRFAQLAAISAQVPPLEVEKAETL